MKNYIFIQKNLLKMEDEKHGIPVQILLVWSKTLFEEQTKCFCAFRHECLLRCKDILLLKAFYFWEYFVAYLFMEYRKKHTDYWFWKCVQCPWQTIFKRVFWYVGNMFFHQAFKHFNIPPIGGTFWWLSKVIVYFVTSK